MKLWASLGAYALANVGAMTLGAQGAGAEEVAKAEALLAASEDVPALLSQNNACVAFAVDGGGEGGGEEAEITDQAGEGGEDDERGEVC